MRTLIISDLHFGSGDDLLRSSRAIEIIEPELQWAERLVINGDLWDLIFSKLPAAVKASRPFLREAARHIDELLYIPGNHDHHVVVSSADRRRSETALDIQQDALFRVDTAEELLRELCPGPEIKSAYPVCELQGSRLTHGHYTAQHSAGLAWRTLDWLGWRLAGDDRREDGLKVTDYEALITPLYELMYQISQLPKGQHSRVQNERLLAFAGAVVSSPGRVGRQVTELAKAVIERRRPPEVKEQLIYDELEVEVLHAMEKVAVNLEIPSGPIIFGHTHDPIAGREIADGRWTLYNSGSWVFDSHSRHKERYRHYSWPGTVLRLNDGRIELRRLMEDLDDGDLYAMVGAKPPRKQNLLTRRVTFKGLRPGLAPPDPQD